MLVIGPFKKLPVQLYEVGVPPVVLHDAVRVTCPPPNGSGEDGFADTVHGPGASGPILVPINETLDGLPAALLGMLTLAVRIPIAVGLNDTLKLQVPLGLSVALLQLFGPTTYSPWFAPPRVNAPSTRLPVPLLVNTTDCAELVVLVVCEPNVSALVESVTAGAVGAAPVPVNETLDGLPAALLGMLTLAVRVPVDVGLNETLKLQVPFGITVALLQLFDATT